MHRDRIAGFELRRDAWKTRLSRGYGLAPLTYEGGKSVPMLGRKSEDEKAAAAAQKEKEQQEAAGRKSVEQREKAKQAFSTRQRDSRGSRTRMVITCFSTTSM